MADPRYIADHLVRIQTEHRDSPSAKLDSFDASPLTQTSSKLMRSLTPEKRLN
jgi:hypothetical protein